jgi:hypothetical protein
VGGEPLDRPGSADQSQTPFRVLVKNGRVRKDWDELLRTRGAVCARCWDHIANTPTQRIGKRYLPLKGSLAQVVVEGHALRQWQYEIDGGARVKVAVGRDFVIIMMVSSGHPKENE